MLWWFPTSISFHDIFHYIAHQQVFKQSMRNHREPSSTHTHTHTCTHTHTGGMRTHAHWGVDGRASDCGLGPRHKEPRNTRHRGNVRFAMCWVPSRADRDGDQAGAPRVRCPADLVDTIGVRNPGAPSPNGAQKPTLHGISLPTVLFTCSPSCSSALHRHWTYGTEPDSHTPSFAKTQTNT